MLSRLVRQVVAIAAAMSLVTVTPTFGSGAADDPLSGSTWELTSMNDQDLPMGVLVTLALADGTASGSGGCNQYSGTYEVDGSAISFGRMAVTAMACIGAAGTAEAAYLAALAEVTTWMIPQDAPMGTQLRLSGSDGVPVLVYGPPDAVPSPSPAALVTGTWFDGLEAGVCFDTGADGSIDYSVPPLIVPCDGPHVFEIAALVSLGAGAFPAGDLGAQAIVACAPAYEAFLGRPAEASGLTPGQIWPDETDWAKGAHDVVCILTSDQPLTGSAFSGLIGATGETLAVYRQVGDTSELWLADAGTGELLRRIAGDAHALVLGTPDWTPDGAALTATVGVAEGDVDAWLFPVDGRTPVVLESGPGKQDGANVSPDGKTLAFISDDGLPEYKIYTRPLAGGAATRLTDHDGRDASPQWSPDGTQILFRRATDGVSDIWVMNADGTEQVRLTDNGAGNYDPRWSPDGEHLLFSSNLGGDYDIWIMDADGSDQRPLTDHPADDKYPTWSEDGSYIAFQSSRYGGPTIWLMLADGPDASLLIAEQPTGYPMFAPEAIE